MIDLPSFIFGFGCGIIGAIVIAFLILVAAGSAIRWKRSKRVDESVAAEMHDMRLQHAQYTAPREWR